MPVSTCLLPAASLASGLHASTVACRQLAAADTPSNVCSLPPSCLSAVQAAGRQLVFLANVDPVDAVRALHGLDAETTLVVIVRWAAGRRVTTSFLQCEAVG